MKRKNKDDEYVGFMSMYGVPMTKQAIAHILLCFFALCYGKKYRTDRHCLYLQNLYKEKLYDGMFNYYSEWHKDYLREQKKAKERREMA